MDNASIIEDIKGLTQDSRRVKPGYLFAALPGAKVDGRDYISAALQNGATAILVPEGSEKPDTDASWLESANPRHDLALMAAAYYKKQPATIAAVTGTNGKTSTVHFIAQLWDALGKKSASLGTLGVRAPGMTRSGSLTTPDPVTLHADLADMAAAGIDHLAMEASSHGLDQHRLDGVKIQAAGFTNLSHDHLDYHSDMEDYLKAKQRLFTDILQPGGTAVLNADIPEYKALKEVAEGRGVNIISYGFKAEDLKILELTPTPQGQALKLELFGENFELTIPLVGGFQVMNALCALGLVLAEDRSQLTDLIPALENLQGVPGRLQLVPGHPKAAIYVDYAHTPNALEMVLTALRPHTENKLICLFGCGGDRDAGKRPVMGKFATELADHVIITDDNPRSEDPSVIRSEILAAAPDAQEIPGRREAIQSAIQNLDTGDVLVIAGKGHEQGQIFADRTDPFDDYTEAQEAMKELTK